MKAPFTAVLLFFITSHLFAQNLASVQQAKDAPYTIVSRGANSRVWQRTVYERDSSGQLVPHIHHYTEVATGMHYQKNGQWLESKEEIDLLPQGGAAATQGQHQVYFPGDIYEGQIELVTPDGIHLHSRPMGIFYDDGVHTVLIAQLKNSVGELVGSNQVIYADAFTDFKADLVCTYRRSGFESDVVFREQPPQPERYGLNPKESRLQLLTEFFDTPDPEQITPTNKFSGLSDGALRFGKIIMGHGKAFALASAKRPLRTRLTKAESNPVYKTWLHLNGRVFLVEQLPYQKISSALQALPSATNASLSVVAPESPLHRVSTSRLLVPSRVVQAQRTKNISLAKADIINKPGFIVDYTTVDSDQDEFGFLSGETYLVSAEVSLDGTTVIQDGAIIKLDNDGQIDIPDHSADIISPASPSTPAIFTSVNDESVGESMAGSSDPYYTGTPAEGDFGTCLNFLRSGSTIVSNMWFRYGAYPIQAQSQAGGARIDVWNCQFLATEICVAGYGDIALHNVLVNQTAVDWPVYVYTGNLTCENVTFDGITPSYGVASLTDPNSQSVFLTNCIFTSGSVVSTDAQNWTTSSIPIYADPSVGTFYLSRGSRYRNQGTTAINPETLALLQTMTTVAPGDGEYPDTDTPDLGYHYPISTDSDNDGLPDGWEMSWFGNTNHVGTELDANGDTLSDDYENRRDPNPILFSLSATNYFVRTNSAALSVNVIGGFPARIAFRLGATNLGGEVWSSYTSSNVTATLGTTDGVYTVWIGLRGLRDISQQTWHALNFTLDRVPPRLAITNLANNTTVSKALLQLQGWASEPLASIVYDLTNADGLVTNQDAFITGQKPDTNLMAFSTNYFQAYDIFLAEGTNIFTLRGTDLAGNVSTTNLTVFLNSSMATNAPVVTVNWPDTNSPIAGTNFTLTGTVDDPTATVTVTGNGFTNLIATVGRDGTFVVPGVPLLASNNTFVVNATNKAGLGTISSGGGVVPASVTITVDPIQSSQISHDFMTITGTVSDPSKDVWVNGVQATVNEDGTWEADNLPVDNNSGSQQLNVGAYPSGSDPNITAPSGVQNPVVPLPPMVQSSSYLRHYFQWGNGSCGLGSDWSMTTQSWRRGVGGDELDESYESESPPLNSGEGEWGTADYLPAIWINLLAASGESSWVDASECGEGFTASYTMVEAVNTSVEVVAGGPPVPGQMQIIHLTASAMSYSSDPVSWSEGDVPVPGSHIKILGQMMTPTATNDQVGELYIAMPSGSKRALPISVDGVDSYSFDIHAEGKNVDILANGIDLSTNTPEFCVGQQIVFTLDGLPAYSNHVTHWKLPDKYVNEAWQHTNSIVDPGSGIETDEPYGSVNYRINSDLLTLLPAITNWFINGEGGTVSVGASLQFDSGKTVSVAAKGQFKIYRPQGTLTGGTAKIGPVDVESTGTIPAAKLDSGGCVFGATVTSLDYSGKANWVQLINRGISGDGLTVLLILQYSTGGNYFLDNDPFYNTQNGDVGTPPVHTSITSGGATDVPFGFSGVGDEPGFGLISTSFLSITDAFNAYLVFNPDPSNSANIWVTIGKVTWGWSGYAALDIPTAHWVLVSGSTNAPTYINTDEFPGWTAVYSNSR